MCAAIDLFTQPDQVVLQEIKKKKSLMTEKNNLLSILSVT